MSPGASTFISGLLTQTAVHWANPVATGRGGRTFDSPVSISCRWEQRQEMFRDTTGQEVRSLAVIYLTTTISVGEYLWLGALASVPDSDPLKVSGAYPVRGVEQTKSVNGRESITKVWL